MALSEQEIQLVKKLKSQGKTMAQVAAEIGRARAGGVSKQDVVSPQTKSTYGQRTLEIAKSGLDKMKGAFTDSLAGRNPIETGLKLGSGAIETAFSPITGAVQPAMDATIGKGINYVADKVSDIPTVQKFAMGKGGQIAERVAEGVGNANTMFGAVAGSGAVPKAASKVGNIAVEASENITSNLDNSLTQGRNLVGSLAKKHKDPLTTAIEDATPNYEASSPKIRNQLKSRVKEGGIFKKRTVEPDKLNIEAGTELSKVPGYNPNATKLEKFQVASREVVAKGKKLAEDLSKEKVVVPRREMYKTLYDAVNKVQETSLVLQKADPLMKNYLRVAKAQLKKTDGTLEGYLKFRKVMDDAYENTRGKQAFGSDKITVIDELNKAARDAMTKDLINRAKNVDVKASLKSQWDLYRAIDELWTQAEKESGSKLGRFIQSNPVASKVAETIGKGVGLGGVINLLD